MRVGPFVVMTLVVSVAVFPPAASAASLQTMKVRILEGDYRAAISDGESLIAGGAKDGSMDEIMYLLGISRLKDEDYTGAAADFSAILSQSRRGSFRELAMLGMADAYSLQGDTTKAQKYCNEFLSAYPRSKYKSSAQYRLAQIKLREAESMGSLHLPVSPEYASQQQDRVASAPSKDGGILYSVQIGAFAQEENARGLMNDLSVRGYPAYIENPDGVGKVFRVRAGKTRNYQEILALERKLSNDGFPTKLCP